MRRDFISVIALLDDESIKNVQYYHNLIGNDISSQNFLPHLTIAVYDKPIDLDEIKEWVRYFCSCHKEMSFSLVAVGVFNDSNIFALPGVSHDLHQFYKDFHQKYDDKCKDFFNLNSNEWFPHIGLLNTTLKNAKEKLPILMDAFKVTSIKIKSLRITKRSSNGFTTISEVALVKTHSPNTDCC